jgi:hypothetical protein
MPLAEASARLSFGRSEPDDLFKIVGPLAASGYIPGGLRYSPLRTTATNAAKG